MNFKDATLYDFTAEFASGTKKPLSEFRGRPVLIVNTASKCGFTPQLKDLQALQDRYGPKGFSVLAFPSNDFASQEPGTNQEIQAFCEMSFRTRFPIFAKGPVKGRDAQPLFQWLTGGARSLLGGRVAWNFEKFLIGPDGKLVARYRSWTKPSAAKVTCAIERLLP